MVASLDQRLPFCREAFQLDGLYLRAILFPLRTLLRQLIVVEFAQLAARSASIPSSSSSGAAVRALIVAERFGWTKDIMSAAQ
jgi:hypothetical protein